jgi:hypothetical protein
MGFKFNPFTGNLDVVDGNSITSVSNSDGTVTVSPTTGAVVVSLPANKLPIVDTQASILASTPTSGRIAYCTNLKTFYIADGTNWNICSAYFDADAQVPDLGFTQESNRRGYGTNYVDGKLVANCQIGSNRNSTKGAIKVTEITASNTTEQLQVYLNSGYKTVVTGIDFREVNYILETRPQGLILWYKVYTGDSSFLSPSGSSMIKAYRASLGAYSY